MLLQEVGLDVVSLLIVLLWCCLYLVDFTKVKTGGIDFSELWHRIVQLSTRAPEI